jgi:hypothetical protein
VIGERHFQQTLVGHQTHPSKVPSKDCQKQRLGPNYQLHYSRTGRSRAEGDNERLTLQPQLWGICPQRFNLQNYIMLLSAGSASVLLDGSHLFRLKLAYDSNSQPLFFSGYLWSGKASHELAPS